MEKVTPPGLKARIEALLTTHCEEALAANIPQPGLTIGQISIALELTKADHGDISACLVKLCSSGRAKSRLGPASSPKGRRYVKQYSFIPKPKPPAAIVVSEMDARRALAFAR